MARKLDTKTELEDVARQTLIQYKKLPLIIQIMLEKGEVSGYITNEDGKEIPQYRPLNVKSTVQLATLMMDVIELPNIYNKNKNKGTPTAGSLINRLPEDQQRLLDAY